MQCKLGYIAHRMPVQWWICAKSLRVLLKPCTPFSISNAAIQDLILKQQFLGSHVPHPKVSLAMSLLRKINLHAWLVLSMNTKSTRIAEHKSMFAWWTFTLCNLVNQYVIYTQQSTEQFTVSASWGVHNKCWLWNKHSVHPCLKRMTMHEHTTKYE